MGVGAGGELLQPGHAALQFPAVKGSGSCPSDSPFLIGIKSSVHQLPHLIPVLLRCIKMLEELHKGSFLPLPVILPLFLHSPKPLYKHLPGIPPGPHRPFHGMLVQGFHSGKQLSHFSHEIGGSLALAVRRKSGIGEHQLSGGL